MGDSDLVEAELDEVAEILCKGWRQPLVVPTWGEWLVSTRIIGERLPARARWPCRSSSRRGRGGSGLGEQAARKTRPVPAIFYINIAYIGENTWRPSVCAKAPGGPGVSMHGRGSDRVQAGWVSGCSRQCPESDFSRPHTPNSSCEEGVPTVLF
jgi:hypothetical protein